MGHKAWRVIKESVTRLVIAPKVRLRKGPCLWPVWSVQDLCHIEAVVPKLLRRLTRVDNSNKITPLPKQKGSAITCSTGDLAEAAKVRDMIVRPASPARRLLRPKSQPCLVLQRGAAELQLLLPLRI